MRRFSSTDRRRLPICLGVSSTMTCSDVSTYPSWTLSDVPTSGSILIYSHFVQTVLTSRLPILRDAIESVAHANRIAADPALLKAWVEKNDGKTALEAFKKEFEHDKAK